MVAEQYPKTTLVLIRHGQAIWGKRGDFGRTVPLTDLGRRQVTALASGMQAGEHVDALYVSPFRRAVETADILAHKLGLEAVVDLRLAEFELLLDLPIDKAKLSITLGWR